jgi:hydrogenase/urease accessory protein HupE
MFACCCDQNRSRRLPWRGWLVATWFLAVLFVQTAPAHTPFESNARVTVFADHIEAAVTAGTGLAGALLQEAGIDPTQARGFSGAKAAPEISQRIISLESDGQSIPAQSVRVHGDGLESMLVVKFPRPAANAVKLSAHYASHLPAGAISALVVADEQGRMLGSHLVTSGSSVMEFQLAANVPAVVAADHNSSSNADHSLPTSAATNDATAAAQIPTPSFLDYLKLGIHHIVTGYDHLLFLCGLLVGCKRVAPMLTIITCFTLAHSITLTLAALNVVALSPRIVEPIIAASIIFVGIENFRRGDNVKARCWLALGFGLIHGFGFAGALRESGLGSTASSLVSALFSFNLGVELGQLVIAAIFLGFLWQLRRFKPVEQYATPVISAAVIALGGWWLVERTLLP